MNYYETLYIVHSALEAGRLKDIVLTVENSLKESGGSILATEIWGKKKLGYLIVNNNTLITVAHPYKKFKKNKRRFVR